MREKQFALVNCTGKSLDVKLRRFSPYGRQADCGYLIQRPRPAHASPDRRSWTTTAQAGLRQTSEWIRHVQNLLARRDIQDGVPYELHQPIKRVLAQPLYVAVPTVLGEFGFVETRSNPIGLDTLGP